MVTVVFLVTTSIVLLMNREERKNNKIDFTLGDSRHNWVKVEFLI